MKQCIMNFPVFARKRACTISELILSFPLRTILEPLISHVRLPFIDPEQLIECVKPTGVIDHSKILQAISYHISKKPMYPPHHVQVFQSFNLFSGNISLSSCYYTRPRALYLGVKLSVLKRSTHLLSLYLVH